MSCLSYGIASAKTAVEEITVAGMDSVESKDIDRTAAKKSLDKDSKVKPKKEEDENYELGAMTVSSSVEKLFPKTDYATPSYDIDKEAIDHVNVITVEDTFRYSPGLLIRRRSVGDPNGNLGIRGSNVFQTAHSMVFADGIPLHNPLRTSFNGAPRWSIVAPSEVESAEVLYGPFSAQYSGNSFGGVVNINTRMPEKFEAQMDATGIFQDMHRAGREELLTGYRTFISAGDRFDKFSVYAFYNRLENEGQPLTLNVAPVTASAAGIPVQGGQGSVTPQEKAAIIYGDQGLENATTDLYKLKLGYDFTPDLQGRFTIAYEDRERDNDNPFNLLKDGNGNPVWSGTVNQSGFRFSVPGSAFSVSEQEREALNYGLNLKGKISDNWSIDTTASYYDAFNDQTVSSNFNPSDPLNDNTGQVSEVDAWWAAYDLKLATDRFFGRDDLSFMGGYQFNHANLNLDVYDSENYISAAKNSHVSDSGGQTQLNSGFAQLDWRFIPDWSVMAGVRLDNWQSIDGHVRNFSTNNIQNYADRDATRLSPKASLEYAPDLWTFRYSFSKAYRFPIAEELFLSSSRINTETFSFPGLGPENGYFHDLMAQYDIPRGFVRANFFYNQINDEINNTVQTVNGKTVSTFLPIGQTETIGVDLTYQQNEVFDLPLDMMINGTFMNKEITENPANPSLVGNEWDRIPRLLVNATATYHILPVWDATVGVRYRSDSFQRLDNTDTAAKVMGGTDESTFVDLKTTYHLPEVKELKSSISAGIDNLFDVNAFENHPYPQRTFYITASVKY
ncbi:MAG: TonB-dependent receptor [Gammaproteobacteria bacterium]